MGIVFHYPSGATPLDADEAAALIPAHIATQGQLNAWESENISEADDWAFSRKHKDLLSIDFMKRLHKRMLGDTWRWAGQIRLTEKNLGFVPPENIAADLANLCRDVETQIEFKSWSVPEIAARFHHRLVYIHPFVNGNGRFGRMMADLLLVKLGHERFDWGTGIGTDGEVRVRYIRALQAADRRDVQPLLAFLKIAR
jgi:Fic-DOC domain mobile mystery protein B